MSHDTEEWCKIWRKINLLFQKWQELGEFWFEHSKVSKDSILIGPFCANYLMFDLKKYREVIFHGTEESCKIRRKTDLWFGKWNGEFGKFSPKHLKVSKSVLSWDPFARGKICMSSKMCDDTEEWWKIWRGIYLSFQNWHKEIWRILIRALESLKNLHVNGLILTKVYYAWAKKVQRSYI